MAFVMGERDPFLLDIQIMTADDLPITQYGSGTISFDEDLERKQNMMNRNAMYRWLPLPI